MKRKVSARDRIMDISLNLARLGNWTADSYEQKSELIKRFIAQTDEYIKEVSKNDLSSEIKPTFSKFKNEFNKLKSAKIDNSNKDIWAEKALTWANILQHRSVLA